MPPCNQCTNPTLCTDRCQVYAEELRSCTCHPDDNPPKPCPRKFAYSDCVAAHVEAGEMPGPRCDRCNDTGWWYSDPLDSSSLEPCCDFPAPKGEAGEMEAGKEDQRG